MDRLSSVFLISVSMSTKRSVKNATRMNSLLNSVEIQFKYLSAPPLDQVSTKFNNDATAYVFDKQSYFKQRTDMTFEIKPIDRGTFDTVWTPEIARQLDKIIYATENWIDELEGRTWAVDEIKGAHFIRVQMANRMDGATCYALIQDGEFALIRKVKYGVYTIVVTSAGFRVRLGEVQQMIEEALLLGGEFLNGKGAKSGILDAYWPILLNSVEI